ncbi:MAG: isoprenylcysteine carboxylmethyltransferase family protein [Chloroflexi bacterium]|nr:isoprenylcysteine carboxylmethyltransferase family protein [Chloroflexota bacterium]
MATNGAASSRRGRVLFARPSREGLLICAASLMPAYLFMILSWVRLAALFDTLENVGTLAATRGELHAWVAVGHQGLTSAFMLLVTWLFLIRRPSLAVGRSIIADVAAIAGSTVILGVAMAPATTDDIVVLILADALMLAGLAVTLVGLASLGRSFGVMPRARGLVTTGLYRSIRHPIYLGEFVAFGGTLLVVLSPLTAAVYAVFVLLQMYRIQQEERTLSAAYPEYAAYQATTARLLPGLY